MEMKYLKSAIILLTITTEDGLVLSKELLLVKGQ